MGRPPFVKPAQLVGGAHDGAAASFIDLDETAAVVVLVAIGDAKGFDAHINMSPEVRREDLAGALEEVAARIRGDKPRVAFVQPGRRC